MSVQGRLSGLPLSRFTSAAGDRLCVLAKWGRYACEGSADTLKWMTLLVAAAQLALVAGAYLTRVFLHGDGSYFVFVIAAEQPWALKWYTLETRLSTYVLTVVPTAWIARVFALDGDRIAAANGAIFFGLQVLQFLGAATLAWRVGAYATACFLAQYAFAWSGGFGFPSEIELAPGFFWIALLALSLARPLPWVAMPATLGLLFSHELAMPAVLVVGWFAFRRMRDMEDSSLRVRFRVFLAVLATAIAAWVCTSLLGGGSGGNPSLIYVFDPRRVLNNPTIWVMVTAALGSWFVATRGSFLPTFAAVGAALAGCMLTLAAWPFVNYGQGRYDSSRTLTGIGMLVLGLIFVRGYYERAPPGKWAGTGGGRRVLCALSASLAVSLTASTLFLVDWSESLTAFRRAVAISARPPAPSIVTDLDAAQRDPAGWQRVDRLGFPWTWPYRSIVIAPGFRPAAIIVSQDYMSNLCRAERSHASGIGRIPAETLEPLVGYACAQPAPPDRRATRRWLRSVLGLP